MIRLIKGIVFIAGIASVTVNAQTYEINEATTIFVAKGNPGFLKITGENAVASGSVTKHASNWTGEIIANLKPIKTGIDLRDKHMHEKYLETEKFPTATLKVTTAEWKESNCQFKGTLEIKGVTKPIDGKCELETDSQGFAGEVSFVFSIEDYPIGVPSYLGIKVADSVTVTAQFKAITKKTTH